MKKTYVGCILFFIFTFLFFILYNETTENIIFKEKNIRILACMSSYKRPIFLSGQILRLMNQTYPVDISISIKGIPEHFINNVLYHEWKKFITSGRLKIRVDSNREQYSNFLDTVRNINLDEYDLFCKIDDDDFYGPDYFFNIVKTTNKKLDYGISYTQNAYTINEGAKEVLINVHNGYLKGPTMCFTRKMIKLFLEIEKNPNLLNIYLPEENFEKYAKKREDGLFYILSKKTYGEESRLTPKEDMAIGRQYPSVLRGGYLK